MSGPLSGLAVLPGKRAHEAISLASRARLTRPKLFNVIFVGAKSRVIINTSPSPLPYAQDHCAVTLA